MFEPLLRTLSLAALSMPAFLSPAYAAGGGSLAVAENHTVSTLCAEHDNVNIALLSLDAEPPIESFCIEARHPGYHFDEDQGDEDFTNCPPPTHQDTFYSDPGAFSVYDDGFTAIVAVRNHRFWLPTGMTAIGPHGTVVDAHYIAVHRQLDAHDYPQVLVFYSDGNLRLKPFPPPDRADTLFGSSVVVGPAPISDRPFVDVASIEYRPLSDSFEVVYASGDSATIHFEAVSREATRIRVEAAFETAPGVPFATFRSMYVREGNTDVDHVVWEDGEGRLYEDPIVQFATGSGRSFFFKRNRVSQHNTSAPNLWIGDFRAAETPHGFLRGDSNGDGKIDVTDPLLTLDYQFLRSVSPTCLDALDFDDSGAIDVTDAINNLAHQFLGGPPPRPPGKGSCGVDPTDDPLSCVAFESCR